MDQDTDAETFLKAVGQRLRQARQLRGLSLEAVAERLELKSKQAVGHWETGVNPIDLRKLRRLARIYETTVMALVAEDLPTDDLLAMMRRALEATPKPLPAASVALDATGTRYLNIPPAPHSVQEPPPPKPYRGAAKARSAAPPKRAAKVARR